MRELAEGVTLAAFATGNRRIIKALKARTAAPEPNQCEHPDHKKEPSHAEHCPNHPAPQQETIPAEHPFLAWVKRVGGTIGALVLLWPIVGKWVPAVAGGGLAIWVIAALIAGQTAPSTENTAEDDAQTAEEVAEEPRATVPTSAEALSLTATLTASGNSVLLTRLAADLGTAHPSWTSSTKAVRALLSEAGVPVREGVRTPDGNGPGVHHQDVPPLPFPAEPPAVVNVGAGQSANANANNASVPAGREGFVTMPHPTDPNRTIVVHAA